MDIRPILVRSRARKFANDVKASGMALSIPEEIIDWLKDEEVPAFFEHCQCFGIQKRIDYLWEKK